MQRLRNAREGREEGHGGEPSMLTDKVARTNWATVRGKGRARVARLRFEEVGTGEMN